MQEVRTRATAQYESPQYRRILDLPLTQERARWLYVLQKAYWNLNRRDCWGFAQGSAPMDVKKLIWEHEEDELAGNKERGVEDHYALQVRQSAALRPLDRRFPATRRSARRRATVCYALYPDGQGLRHWLC